MLRKIYNRQILRLKCTKIDFGWGSAPDPAGELIALPQTSYLDLKGPTSKVREGTKGEEREGNGERGKRGVEGGERIGKGRDIPVPDWESEKVATLYKRKGWACSVVVKVMWFYYVKTVLVQVYTFNESWNACLSRDHCQLLEMLVSCLSTADTVLIASS